MREAFAVRHGREREWSRPYPLLLGMVLGLTLGALGFAILASATDLLPSVQADATASEGGAVEFPARELSREWRWSPKGLEVEHMYRRHETPRLDWIRESGRR